ncbi:MAG: family 10 glycosylhydrolase [Saprospiraceae bacterium]
MPNTSCTPAADEGGFWFEFGWIPNGEMPDATHPILSKHPDWIGRGHDGQPCHYNNSDYYFNAYHPQVQQFILDLIAESMDKYPDVDGIQGDDRLPASPADSGYDSLTVARYRATHDGSLPPADFRDSLWVNWRLELLNSFVEKMYRVVKAKRVRQ